MTDHDQIVNISHTLGRIEGKLDIFIETNDGRVKKIEDSQTRQWWFSVAIAPVLALLHAAARKLGMNV